MTRSQLVGIGLALGAAAAVALRTRQALRRRRLARLTKAELYERAKQVEVPGRSTMTRDELADALRRVV